MKFLARKNHIRYMQKIVNDKHLMTTKVHWFSPVPALNYCACISWTLESWKYEVWQLPLPLLTHTYRLCFNNYLSVLLVRGEGSLKIGMLSFYLWPCIYDGWCWIFMCTMHFHAVLQPAPHEPRNNLCTQHNKIKKSVHQLNLWYST